MGQGAEDAGPEGDAERGRGVSGKASGNRFGWLSEEEDLRDEEVRREEAPGVTQRRPEVPIEGPADPPGTVPGSVPGTAPGTVPGVARRRRRNRPKNPKALRNDPGRVMAGARIRKDVRRRVEQALADPAVVGEEGTNFSLLVESLLTRWLQEVGYPLDER